MGKARHIGVPGGVYGDAVAVVVPAAAQVGGVHQSAACGIDLAHKGIAGAPVSRLDSARAGTREVGRLGKARHIGVAGRVYGDAVAIVATAAAQVSGVHQSAACGIDLGHKGVVVAAPVSRLDSARAGTREVGRLGKARHIGVAGGIYGDAVALVVPAAAQVGGVRQHWIDHQRLASVIVGNAKTDSLPFFD